MSDFPIALSAVVDNVDDALAKYINNLEAKLGIDGSAVTTSHDYKLGGVTGSDKAASIAGTETLTNKTLTSPKLNEDVALTSTATELNTLDGSLPRKSIIAGTTQGVKIPQNSTKYIGIAEISIGAYLIPIPTAGTLRRLYVYSASGPASGQTYICTIMNNNAATDLTCTIPSSTKAGNDITHTAAVTAGVRISLRVVSSATAGDKAFVWCVEYDMN